VMKSADRLWQYNALVKENQRHHNATLVDEMMELRI
jgi:hypothetical protein